MFVFRLPADNWPALKKAADWLISRDEYGLPVQRSFWGDWKDVTGVKDRKYSPFSGLLYLAAMQRMEALSGEMNDTVAKNAIGKLSERDIPSSIVPIRKAACGTGIIIASSGTSAGTTTNYCSTRRSEYFSEWCRKTGPGVLLLR